MILDLVLTILLFLKVERGNSRVKQFVTNKFALHSFSKALLKRKLWRVRFFVNFPVHYTSILFFALYKTPKPYCYTIWLVVVLDIWQYVVHLLLYLTVNVKLGWHCVDFFSIDDQSSQWKSFCASERFNHLFILYVAIQAGTFFLAFKEGHSKLSQISNMYGFFTMKILSDTQVARGGLKYLMPF